MPNQHTASFTTAQAIRRCYRRGMSVDDLAELFDQSEYIIGKVLATRTIEAAAAVLYCQQTKATAMQQTSCGVTVARLELPA